MFQPELFRPDDLVCDVLAKYPQVFSVFERHGMCEECKQSPPPVPLALFASKHCNGEIEKFLEELAGAVN